MGDFMVKVGRGRLLASFTAEGEGELSVDEGITVGILQPRVPGTLNVPEGWLCVRHGEGEGFVPESYIELLQTSVVKPARVAPSPPGKTTPTPHRGRKDQAQARMPHVPPLVAEAARLRAQLSKRTTTWLIDPRMLLP